MQPDSIIQKILSALFHIAILIILINTVFDDNGYKYFNEGKYVLFSADNTHNYLFDYVTKDLSSLPSLLEQYFFQKMDTTTLKIKENSSNNENINKMIELLKSIHPYYEYEYKKVLIKAIGVCFNNFLVYSILETNKAASECVEKNELYIEKFIKLIPDILIPYNIFPNELSPVDFYHKFLVRINGQNYPAHQIEETFVFGKPQKNITCFHEEIKTQKNIFDMLYFLLDIAVPELQNLSTSQRIWLYSNIFIDSELEVMHQFSFCKPALIDNPSDYQQKINDKHKFDEIFEPLYVLRKSNSDYDRMPDHLITNLHLAINLAKEISSANIYEEYEINNLQQLLYLETMYMIQAGTMIRKCRNCGKYFVVKNRKVAYCDRINNSGICCSAVGSKQTFQRKLESEEELKMYNRAYKTHHARLRNKKMSQSEFEIWTREAKENLKKVRMGKLELAAFKEWLKL